MKKIVLLLVIPLLVSCVNLHSIRNKLTLRELEDLHRMGKIDRMEFRDYMTSKGWVLKSDNEDTLSFVYGQYPEDKESALLEYVIERDLGKYFTMDPDPLYDEISSIRYATHDSNHYQSIIDELHNPENKWKLEPKTSEYAFDTYNNSYWRLFHKIYKEENTVYYFQLYDYMDWFLLTTQ